MTVTNTGNGPLAVTGLAFTGSDAGDFLIGSSTCGAPVAPGSSCQVTVRFAPQAQGARSATLQISSNNVGGPVLVTLSGTGGQLPQGPTGQTGATGATGATGPQGPPGKIELVVCTNVTKMVTTKGHKHKVTVKKCATRLVSGRVKFVTADRDLAASVSRGHVIYASEVAVPTGAERWQLLLTRDTRPLRPGHYNRILRTLHGRRSIVQRTTITIT